MAIIIPWDGRNYHEKCDTIKGDHKSENYYFNRGTFSSGQLSPWIVPMTDAIDTKLLSANEQATLHNKALSKMDENLVIIQNYYEAIHERREAYSMLGQAGTQLLKFLKNWKNPKYWKSLKDGATPADLPSAWLMYQFGVKPLVGTIDSALNLLGRDFPIEVVKGSTGCKISNAINNESYWVDDYHDVKGFCSYEIRAHIVPGNNPNAALSNVVGLATPFSTAWSVIPWAWAVDYFINVGDLLANFENRFPGVEIKSVWKSSFCKYKLRSTRYSRSTLQYTYNNGEGHHFVRTETTMDRMLQYSYPTIGNNQFANLFSAIALAMKGRQ